MKTIFENLNFSVFGKSPIKELKVSKLKHEITFRHPKELLHQVGLVFGYTLRGWLAIKLRNRKIEKYEPPSLMRPNQIVTQDEA